MVTKERNNVERRAQDGYSLRLYDSPTVTSNSDITQEVPDTTVTSMVNITQELLDITASLIQTHRARHLGMTAGHFCAWARTDDSPPQRIYTSPSIIQRHQRASELDTDSRPTHTA